MIYSVEHKAEILTVRRMLAHTESAGSHFTWHQQKGSVGAFAERGQPPLALGVQTSVHSGRQSEGRGGRVWLPILPPASPVSASRFGALAPLVIDDDMALDHASVPPISL